MDTDLFLVIGIVLGALSIPSLLAAYSEGRPPRAGAILVLTAGVLVVLAVSRKPGGYDVAELPDIFVRVASRLMN